MHLCAMLFFYFLTSIIATGQFIHWMCFPSPNVYQRTSGTVVTIVTADPRNTTCLWQRFNVVLISETFAEADDAPDLWSL